MKKIYSQLIQLSFIACIVISFTSCNLHIEKRRYRKGYYVDFSYHHKNTHGSYSTKTEIEQPKTVVSSEVQLNESVELKDPLIKLAKNPNEHKKNIVQNTKIQTSQRIIEKDDDHCDIITFTDGTQVEVLVEEITETEIKYKKCNFKEGPSYRVSKSKVKKVDMYNGEVYVPQPDYSRIGGKSINGQIITSLILGILAFICVIIGAVLVFSLGGGFGGFVASAALAPAGIFSLVGLIIGATQLRKGAHPLAWVAFGLNVLMQILAILFTVFMFL